MAALKDERLRSEISSDRLYDCVNVILSYQNPSGGWATYENTRSFAWVEVSSFEGLMACLHYWDFTLPIVTISRVSKDKQKHD